jgi:hypothetical protein
MADQHPDETGLYLAIEARCPLCQSLDCNLSVQLPLGQCECWECATVYALRPNGPARVIRKGRLH